LLFLVTFSSHAQKRLFGHIICQLPDNADSAALKENFLEEMEKGVIIMADYLNSRQQLEALFSDKHEIPDSIKPDVYMALKHFPELHTTKIVVKSGRIHGTMNARPSLTNIFRKRADRKYLLIINNNKGRSKGLNINDISFNARIGWFGHEFAHFSTYQQMNSFEIIWFGIKYGISNKFVRKVERYTNKVAAERGLIFQIFQGEQYILMFNSLMDNYRKRTVYRSLSYQEYICLWNTIKEKNKIVP